MPDLHVLDIETPTADQFRERVSRRSQKTLRCSSWLESESYRFFSLAQLIFLQVPVQPLFFHTCLYMAEVPMTCTLAELLNSPIHDDLSVVSPFDLWMHEAVFPMSHAADEGAETFSHL